MSSNEASKGPSATKLEVENFRKSFGRNSRCSVDIFGVLTSKRRKSTKTLPGQLCFPPMVADLLCHLSPTEELRLAFAISTQRKRAWLEQLSKLLSRATLSGEPDGTSVQIAN